MRAPHRSISQIVEDQGKIWQARTQEKGKESEEKTPERVITISGEPGSGGRVIGKLVSETLHFDYFDRELIHHVAESANFSDAMVETLDEKGHRLLQDWISAFFTDRHLWSDQYMQHLVKVVLTIARHGHAVVLGRGAAFIIPPENALRVRVIAPLEMRLRNFSHEFNITLDEAQKLIRKAEAERVKFIKQNFNAEIGDMRNYDLVIDSWRLGIKGAANVIIAAHKHFGSF